LMEDAVFKVDPKTDGMTVAELLSEHNFGSVPVVEGDDILLGNI
jgi:CBS domain-containing protein